MTGELTEPRRLCLWCTHIHLNVGSPGYSDVTPGSDFWVDCQKRHWEFIDIVTEADFYACLRRAEDCDDYEFNPELLK